MAQQQFFARKASGLIRTISARDALMFNMLLMGLNLPFLFAVFATALYPGVNLVWSSTIAAPLVFVIGMTWLFFTLCMPRAGGDFVWVSRSIHPSIGLVDSLPLVIIYIGGSTAVIGQAVQNPGIAGMLAAFGQTNAIPFWTSTNVSFAIAVISIIVSLLVIGAGTKVTFKFAWVCFIIVCMGCLVYPAVMLSAGHAAFIARFEAVSGTTPQALINAAQSAGYNTGFTATGMILGMVYMFLNYYGFAWSSYYAGEMKEFQRSNVIAILGSIVLFWFITTFQYWVTYVVVGPDLFHAMSYLAVTGNSAYTLPYWPYLTYLVTFATDNPVLGAIAGFSLFVEAVATYVTYWVMTTRVMFAWSFDRLIPTKFSEIDQRFHAPRNAILLTALLAAVFVTLEYYGGQLLGFFTYLIMGAYTSGAIVGLAAIIFPYRRKDIFEKAPSYVKARVLGVPVMSILGLVTFISATSIAVFTTLPAFTGAPVNPLYVFFVVSIFVFAFVYYWVVVLYNKRRGIDMGVAYRELPPL
ncbi:MAG: amino acid permease [Candidatus Bathyarchaeia archaeon]